MHDHRSVYESAVRGPEDVEYKGENVDGAKYTLTDYGKDLQEHMREAWHGFCL